MFPPSDSRVDNEMVLFIQIIDTKYKERKTQKISKSKVKNNLIS